MGDTKEWIIVARGRLYGPYAHDALVQALHDKVVRPTWRALPSESLKKGQSVPEVSDEHPFMSVMDVLQLALGGAQSLLDSLERSKSDTFRPQALEVYIPPVQSVRLEIPNQAWVIFASGVSILCVAWSIKLWMPIKHELKETLACREPSIGSPVRVSQPSLPPPAEAKMIVYHPEKIITRRPAAETPPPPSIVEPPPAEVPPPPEEERPPEPKPELEERQ